MTVRFGGGRPSNVSFSIAQADQANPNQRANLTLDGRTGDVVEWQPYDKMSRGQQLRMWIRPLHTGTAAGFVGQLVAAIASLGGAVLVWTGISLALRRLASWLRRRRKKEIAPVLEPAEQA